MLSEKMEIALNKQINAELVSSYIYLSMAAYFEATNLRGFASWMHLQSQEENGHAMRFFNYINERGGRVRLQTIETPPNEWESPLEAFQDSYNHERKISSMINDLANLAYEEKDHATANFLQWFISEQVEEEANVNQVVENLKLIGDNKAGLFMLDRELGQRTPEAEEE